MKEKTMANRRAFVLYSVMALAITLLLSAYPVSMGVRVVTDMIKYGTVYAEDYPKYIIPYTPVSLAALVGTALMLLFVPKCGRYSVIPGSLLSLGVFFAAELSLENLVTVTETFEEQVISSSSLEGWQMFMCYIPPSAYETRQWTEVNVLLGEYSPAFKLHFYLIAVVLILSRLNAVYGFGDLILSGDRSREKMLSIQTVTAAAFLGMCIWACYTAFYRTGELTVSFLSALLMSVFFVLFGLTTGVFVGSFLLGKPKTVSVAFPGITASLVSLAMYAGELILLDGHLYRFGEGVLFDGLPLIVLAPIDLLIVLCSGLITGLICFLLNCEKAHNKALKNTSIE